MIGLSQQNPAITGVQTSLRTQTGEIADLDDAFFNKIGR
jgi:hypothetical protein